MSLQSKRELAQDHHHPSNMAHSSEEHDRRYRQTTGASTNAQILQDTPIDTRAPSMVDRVHRLQPHPTRDSIPLHHERLSSPDIETGHLTDVTPINYPGERRRHTYFTFHRARALSEEATAGSSDADVAYRTYRFCGMDFERKWTYVAMQWLVALGALCLAAGSILLIVFVSLVAKQKASRA